MTEAEPVPLSIHTDSADRFLAGPDACPENDRMLTIALIRRPADYLVHVVSTNQRGEKSRPVTASLRAAPREIAAWRQALHKHWEEEVVNLEAAGGRRGVWHPTSSLLDLRGIDQPQVDRMWRNLAHAGQALFQLLFANGDEQLNAVGERLAAEVRAPRLTISVHSDEVVIPWALLFTPPVPDATIALQDPVGLLQGFWGIRHIIEHTFTQGRRISAIPVNGRVQASGYTDTRIDRRKPRTVHPVIRFLGNRTDLRHGTTRDELRDNFADPNRDDQLLYFCCHCEDDDLGDPLLRLSDGGFIAAGDLESWIGRPGLRRNPFVFVNACNSAFLPSFMRTHIGAVLVGKGATGLVGPNVSVPQRFAMSYATALLRAMLRDGQAVGPAMRDLAEHYAVQRRNPLGLAYSAYQSMDAHFCRHTTEESPNGRHE